MYETSMSDGSLMTQYYLLASNIFVDDPAKIQRRLKRASAAVWTVPVRVDNNCEPKHDYAVNARSKTIWGARALMIEGDT